VSDAAPGFVPDAVMVAVGRGIELRVQGERDQARRLFLDLWNKIGGDGGDAFHRCAIAHSMADACDDVAQELAWDVRALAAAESLTDSSVAARGGSTVAAFYPSLHLNLADCYYRLGDMPAAREHVGRGRTALNALPDDGYSQMIRDGFDRLDQALT
jgi:hypothetical protein